jgi:hypothetical protein
VLGQLGMINGADSTPVMALWSRYDAAGTHHLSLHGSSPCHLTGFLQGKHSPWLFDPTFTFGFPSLA